MKIYPVKIEAVNDDGELQFTVTTFDQSCAEIDLRQQLHSPASLEQLVDGLRKAFAMLELEP